MDVYFFGVMGQAGHYLYYGRNIVNPRHLPKDFPFGVRALDGPLLPPMLPQIEGRAELISLAEWTVLAFWDRSGDKRMRSSSTFIIRGAHGFQQAVEAAKSSYPQVWDRFDFDIYQRKVRNDDEL